MQCSLDADQDGAVGKVEGYFRTYFSALVRYEDSGALQGKQRVRDDAE